jgi:hypothetical protein
LAGLCTVDREVLLTSSASTSALQPPPLEGTKHLFVPQAFYFCSY